MKKISVSLCYLNLRGLLLKEESIEGTLPIVNPKLMKNIIAVWKIGLLILKMLARGTAYKVRLND